MNFAAFPHFFRRTCVEAIGGCIVIVKNRNRLPPVLRVIVMPGNRNTGFTRRVEPFGFSYDRKDCERAQQNAADYRGVEPEAVS